MRDKAVIAYCHQVAYESMRLDPATPAYDRASLYLDKWPNKSPFSDCASIQVDRLHNLDVLAKRHVDHP
jgi:hypothetical protein